MSASPSRGSRFYGGIEMVTFIALYRGSTVASSQLVAVSANPQLVTEVAAQLLASNEPSDDPIVAAQEHGRRRALRLVMREARNSSGF